LERFAALDVIRERASDLRHKPPLILGIPEGSRSELGGPQVEIGPGEFGVLSHRLSSRGVGARLEKALLFDDPRRFAGR